jgi:hypothetical protein
MYNVDPEVRFWATPPYHPKLLADPAWANGHGCLRPSVVHPAAFTFKIPKHISYDEAALVEPLAVGMHACTLTSYSSRTIQGSLHIIFVAASLNNSLYVCLASLINLLCHMLTAHEHRRHHHHHHHHRRRHHHHHHHHHNHKHHATTGTKAKIKPGNVACIVGAGPIGMLTALAALASGCAKVFVADPVQTKLNVAEKLVAAGKITGNKQTNTHTPPLCWCATTHVLT